MNEYESTAADRERLNNVRRLAYALYCTTGDSVAMQQLARILRYMPEQLAIDINDLESYTSEKVCADREAAELTP